jgi:hypothetical protein
MRDRELLTVIYGELKESSSPCPLVDWALARIYDQVEDDIRDPRPEDVASWDEWLEYPVDDKMAYREKRIGRAEAAAIRRSEAQP